MRDDHHQPTSWLCPTPSDRARFLDMQVRLRIARALTAAGVGAMAVSMAGDDVNYRLPLVIIAMLVIVVAGSVRLDQRARPELWVFVSTVLNIQAAVAIAAAMTGGPRSPLVSLLAIPVVMVATRFSIRGLMIGAPVSVGLVLATTLGIDPGYVGEHPQSMMIPLVTVLVTAAYLGPLVASDVRHRTDSMLDALTGLLNRRAFETRFAEVAVQATAAAQPVSVVLIDIDHFKGVNDRHGHQTGDAVLRGVADALRGSLRAFELLYRLGGEEFLLLLPGADERAAAAVAENLRAAVASERHAGVELTCSIGIATAREDEIDLKPLLALADAALYEAKRLGRNQVRASAAPFAPLSS